jgi:hypothetical protein
MILSGVLFLGLGCYAITPLIKLPEIFLMLFPVYIWENIAIVDSTYAVIFSSLGLLTGLILLLFIWGYAYPKKEHYARRLKIWLILFNALLAYSLLEAAFIHIYAIPAVRGVRPPTEPNVYPTPYSAIDKFFSQRAYTAPLYSWLFVAYIVMTTVYATISIKVLCLIRGVKNAEALEKDLSDIFNAETDNRLND